MGRKIFCSPSSSSPAITALTSAQLFHDQDSHLSGSRTCSHKVSRHIQPGEEELKRNVQTYLWLLGFVDPRAQHKDGNVVHRRGVEDVVGDGDHLFGADREARLLDGLALGAGEEALAQLEMAARKLPLS